MQVKVLELNDKRRNNINYSTKNNTTEEDRLSPKSPISPLSEGMLRKITSMHKIIEN